MDMRTRNIEERRDTMETVLNSKVLVAAVYTLPFLVIGTILAVKIDKEDVKEALSCLCASHKGLTYSK